MAETLRRVDGRKITAVLAAAGAILVGAAISNDSSASASTQETAARCLNDSEKGVHTQFNMISPNAGYCLEEAFPMGRTNIFHDGNYGELGLVALKINFEGKPYACVVPVTGHDNTTTLTPEAFSLNGDCLPDPGNK